MNSIQGGLEQLRNIRIENKFDVDRCTALLETTLPYVLYAVGLFIVGSGIMNLYEILLRPIDNTICSKMQFLSKMLSTVFVSCGVLLLFGVSFVPFLSVHRPLQVTPPTSVSETFPIT
jgi:hypothetical protein